jgi:hypothetical protein
MAPVYGFRPCQPTRQIGPMARASDRRLVCDLGVRAYGGDVALRRAVRATSCARARSRGKHFRLAWSTSVFLSVLQQKWSEW